ncbi:MAG: dihydrodipicolinate synthase family protein [Chloroflexota bacterium]|nr:dihydrodipicolinate synthase family protein [Chloroflexota bacterium]
MKNLKLHGIFPALATAYREDESIDEEQFRLLIRRLLPTVDGFVVNGTTGDFPLLTHAERRRAVEIVAEEVRGERLVIAGTGAIATGEAITLTRAAQEAGADAALVVAPYYLRPSAAGLQEHFSAIAAAVPELPLLLYNFPQLVGQPIPVDVIRALQAAHANIIGMKDTSGDLIYMLAVLEQLPADFNVLVGQGAVVLPALAAGAVGAVLACANLIPQQWQQLLCALDQGELESARAIQYQAQQVSRLVGKGGSLTVRAGLKMLGLPIGPPRRPLTFEGALTGADLAQLRALLPA